jgi:hypothetical protein
VTYEKKEPQLPAAAALLPLEDWPGRSVSRSDSIAPPCYSVGTVHDERYWQLWSVGGQSRSGK